MSNSIYLKNSPLSKLNLFYYILEYQAFSLIISNTVEEFAFPLVLSKVYRSLF